MNARPARRPSLVALALLAALLAGCAAPTPAPVLLTLPTLAPAAAPAPAAAASAPGAAGALLAVRRVGIPEYLVARRVRYRADPSTLAEWPNTYWGERIEIGVSRALVAALRRQLPGWSLCEADCAEQHPSVTLQVEFAPMDFVRSARRLDAGARITVGGAGAAPQVREQSYEISAAADTAQAQAQAIAELIEQTASAAAPLVRSAADAAGR